MTVTVAKVLATLSGQPDGLTSREICRRLGVLGEDERVNHYHIEHVGRILHRLEHQHYVRLVDTVFVKGARGGVIAYVWVAC